jgi:hypothetical protein
MTIYPFGRYSIGKIKNQLTKGESKMNNTASLPNTVSMKELGYKEQYQAQVNQYMAKQHPIVRGLHYMLQGLSMFCFVLASVCFFIALYYTGLWAATGSFTSLGKATNLPIAWVTYGLSMSFMVFPWGLDSMLMRVFPAVIFPAAWYRSNKPIQFKTGIGAFFAGLGIMCAGAPGAAYFIDLASQALQKLS